MRFVTSLLATLTLCLLVSLPLPSRAAPAEMAKCDCPHHKKGAKCDCPHKGAKCDCAKKGAKCDCPHKK